jgi:hypothetical protein
MIELGSNAMTLEKMLEKYREWFPIFAPMSSAVVVLKMELTGRRNSTPGLKSRVQLGHS